MGNEGTKFTRGPWTALIQRNKAPRVMLESRQIAFVDRSLDARLKGEPCAEAIANAALIAASPTMYDELERCKAEFMAIAFLHPEVNVSAALNAIAETLSLARGERK